MVRVAAAQIAPDLDSADGTLARVLETMRDAARRGVELIVFPETFVPYYPYFSFVLPPVLQGAPHLRLAERAVVVPGPVTQAVAERARHHGMVVILGVNERDHGSLYNTQLCSMPTARSRSSAARSRPRTTSAWSGAWETARG